MVLNTSAKPGNSASSVQQNKQLQRALKSRRPEAVEHGPFGTFNLHYIAHLHRAFLLFAVVSSTGRGPTGFLSQFTAQEII